MLNNKIIILFYLFLLCIITTRIKYFDTKNIIILIK